MGNHYIQSLSLQEEIPRLSSVARKIHPLVREFLTQNPPPEFQDNVYVELGSGTGIMTYLLKNQFPGYTMYGIELSPELINYSKNIHPLVNWIEGDFKNQPFADSSVSYYLSHFSLVHINDLKKLKSEINRCLLPGGKFLAIEPILMESDVDPRIKDMFQEFFNVMGGSPSPFEIFLSPDSTPGLELKKEVDLAVGVVDEENDYLDYNYPSMKIGRMGIWSFFGFMGQLLQLRDIYNECLEGYMNKQLGIRSLKYKICLFEKKS